MSGITTGSHLPPPLVKKVTVQVVTAAMFVDQLANNSKYQELLDAFRSSFPTKDPDHLLQLDKAVPWGIQAEIIVLASDGNSVPVGVYVVAKVDRWKDFFGDHAKMPPVPDNISYGYGACVVPRARGLGISTLITSTASSVLTRPRLWICVPGLMPHWKKNGAYVVGNPFKGSDGTTYVMMLRPSSFSLKGGASAIAAAVAADKEKTDALIANALARRLTAKM